MLLLRLLFHSMNQVGYKEVVYYGKYEADNIGTGTTLQSQDRTGFNFLTSWMRRSKYVGLFFLELPYVHLCRM